MQLGGGGGGWTTALDDVEQAADVAAAISGGTAVMALNPFAYSPTTEVQNNLWHTVVGLHTH